MNLGWTPFVPVIEKVLVGNFDKGPRGSLRSFKVSFPVFNTVATTFKFSMPEIDWGP